MITPALLAALAFDSSAAVRPVAFHAAPVSAPLAASRGMDPVSRVDALFPPLSAEKASSLRASLPDDSAIVALDLSDARQRSWLSPIEARKDDDLFTSSYYTPARSAVEDARYWAGISVAQLMRELTKDAEQAATSEEKTRVREAAAKLAPALPLYVNERARAVFLRTIERLL